MGNDLQEHLIIELRTFTKEYELSLFCLFCFNIYQTYLSEWSTRHSYILCCARRGHAVNIGNHIDFHANFCKDHTLQLLMVLFRWSGNSFWISQWIIWVEILLESHLSPSTTAAHRGAKENIHEQHNQKQDTQGYCEPEQPCRPNSTFITGRGNHWSEIQILKISQG